MEMISCQSTRVKAFGYDPETQTLRIEWVRGKPGQYTGVPSEVFDGLKKTESVGRYMQKAVIGQFDYTIDPDPEPDPNG